jgi:GNAT superfamily N-acetyltransferase
MSIIPYHKQHAQAFKDLNIEWLETYFYVEPYDLEVLSNPDTYIIDKGGHIFFSMKNEKVTATVALMKIEENVYELTKMAVDKTMRGRGIGQLLIHHCIDFARKNKFNKLVLYSNTKLENAIYIYKKWGFEEIELESSSSYERANIKMELILKTHKKP